MKKLLIIASTVLLASSMLSADITIKTGWQLLGATQDMNTSMFDNSCVDYMWKYDTTSAVSPEWQIHIANGQNYIHTYAPISSLHKGEGYWVKGNSDCIVSISADTNASIPNNTIVSYNNISTDGLLKASLDLNVTNAFRGVISVDNYLYTVSRDGDLFVFDISTLESTEVPIYTSKLSPAQHIIQNGNYLYISGSQLYILDISNKENPSLVGTFNFPGAWNTPTISSNKMLINNSYNSEVASLLDISNPEAPTLLKTFSSIGKSIINGDNIYSVSSAGSVSKYILSNSNEISEVSIANDNIDSLPYYLYYYNNKFVVITESNIYIYDTSDSMSLLKTISVNSVRASGCNHNVCVAGTKVYDLNNLDSTSLTFGQSTYNADGFPFQVFINENGYVFRGSQEDIKINKLDFN